MMMEAVEHYARIVLAIRRLGAAKMLTQEDRKKLAEMRTKYLANCSA
jgi:hypothetical protein